jgi:transcriptional regulator with XRE-family HTH domain
VIRLTQLRIDKGMTCRELAAAAGLSYTQMRAIESGESKSPRVGTLTRLALALGENVRPSELLMDALPPRHPEPVPTQDAAA